MRRRRCPLTHLLVDVELLTGSGGRHWWFALPEPLPKIPDRPLKPMPWGCPRSACTECGGPLMSAGECDDQDRRRRLVRLACRNRTCSIQDLYFDATTGAIARSPRRVFRRSPSRVGSATVAGKRWCAVCAQCTVGVDPRVKYCGECTAALHPVSAVGEEPCEASRRCVDDEPPIAGWRCCPALT